MARLGTDHVPKRDITGLIAPLINDPPALASSIFHLANNVKKCSHGKPLKSKGLTLAVAGALGFFEGADLTRMALPERVSPLVARG